MANSGTRAKVLKRRSYALLALRLTRTAAATRHGCRRASSPSDPRVVKLRVTFRRSEPSYLLHLRRGQFISRPRPA